MKKLIVFWIIGLALISCQTSSRKKIAAPAPQSFVKELQNAKLLAQRDPTAAINRIGQLLETYAENDMSDDALLLLGDLLIKQKRVPEALSAYDRIISSTYISSLDAKAILRAAKIRIKINQVDQAISTLNKVDSMEIQDRKSLYLVEKLRAPLLFKKKDFDRFLFAGHNLYALSPKASEKEGVLKKVEDLMRIRLSSSDLRSVLREEKLNLFHSLAVLSLSEVYFEEDQPDRARTLINEYSAALKQPRYREKAIELLERAKIYESYEDKVIGVLVPLSGKYEAVGAQVLKGIQMAFQIWTKDSSKGFKLAILDTEGDPERAKIVFDNMMRDDRPLMVIGGLIGKTAEIIVDKSKEYRVPSFVLSQKDGVTLGSRYSFQGADPIDFYTEVVAKAAYTNLGFRKIAILKSNEKFSSEYSDSFFMNFTNLGGEIVTTIEYDMEEKQALSKAVKSLVHLDSTKGREPEYRTALNKWRNSKRRRGKGTWPKLEEILPPKIEFDAVFVADGSKTGGLLASTMAYFDVEDIPLIGTHLWNSPDLVERGQRFVEGALFASSYIDQMAQRSRCGNDFAKIFNEPINIYSYRGFEAGQILQTSYLNGSPSSRKEMTKAIEGIRELRGCLGAIRREKQNFIKPLFLLSVQNREIAAFDPNQKQNLQERRPEN